MNKKFWLVKPDCYDKLDIIFNDKYIHISLMKFSKTEFPNGVYISYNNLKEKWGYMPYPHYYESHLGIEKKDKRTSKLWYKKMGYKYMGEISLKRFRRDKLNKIKTGITEEKL